jgi:membrane protease YdiL (CAAX protease family)
MNEFDQPPQETPEARPAPDPELQLASVPPLPPPNPYAAFPPDLRAPWNVADLGIFLLVYLGINVVLGGLAFVAGAIAFHKTLITLQSDPVHFPIVAVLTQVVISVATILYFWILIRIRSTSPIAQPYEGFWRTIGFRPLGHDGTSFSRVLLFLLAGVGVSVIIAIASDHMGKQPPTPMDNLFQSRAGVLMLMFFGVCVAPLVEEMMFRGFLYPVVARRFGIPSSVLFTGILFGGFHALQLWPAKGLIALLMGVGIVFTWVRARAQSVLASFLMHTAYNSTIFVVLLIQTKGLTDFSHMH